MSLSLGVKNVVGYNRSRLLLNSVYKYVVSDWDIDRSKIRLRRSDDNFEKYFNPSGNKLDTASIDNFLEWNLLNGTEYRDYLYDSKLGVDSDSDGVSDGWTEGTLSNSIPQADELLGQRLMVKDPGFAFAKHQAGIKITGFSQGEEFVFATDYQHEKLNGASALGYKLRYVNSSDVQVGSTEFYTITDTESETYLSYSRVHTVPSDGTIVGFYVELFIQSTDSNPTEAYVWYKNAFVAKNDFVENIGLLTQDDNSDGVANEWIANAIINNTVYTIDSAQKISFTNAQNTTSSSGIERLDNTDLVDGDEFTLKLKLKTDNAYARFAFVALPSFTTINTVTNNESADFTEVTFNGTMPAGSTGYNVYLVTKAKQTGDNGSVWYKDVELLKSKNSAYVTEIQDPYGDNHAIQTTLSDQPVLVNQGVWYDAPRYTVDSDGKHLAPTENGFPSGNVSCTEHAVAKLDSLDTVYRGLFSYGTSEPKQAFGIGTDNTGELQGTFNQVDIKTSGYVNDDTEFFSLTFVYNATTSTATLYLNGNQVAQQTNLTGIFIVPEGDAKIGRYGNITDSIDGYIKKTTLFNEALTPEQVKLLANRK